MYLGWCLTFRVLGMNPRHSSYSKFLLAVLFTSFCLVFVVSLFASSVIAAPEIGTFSSSVVKSILFNLSIIYYIYSRAYFNYMFEFLKLL